MNIKCLITPIVLIFTVIVSFAHDNARVKVEYTERYKNWTGVNKNEKMLLLANGQISHYYNPTSLVVDSILSTPEGTVRLTLWSKRPMKPVNARRYFPAAEPI